MRRLLALAALSCACTTAASAASISCSNLATLADFITQGSSGCDLGGFNFSSFTWTKNVGSKTIASTAVPVSVTVAGASARIQFGGTGTFTASSTNTVVRIDYGLQYQVVGPANISNLTGHINPGALTFSSSADNLTEMVGTTRGGVDLVASQVLLQNGGQQTLEASNNFTPSGAVWVTNALYVQNTTSIRQGTQTATLNSFDQTFTYDVSTQLSEGAEIPEPVGYVLFAAGLAVMGILRKRLS